ncbi:hypothetical protein N7492_004986 [Penicillium capsulatum]|uniref:Uncharacterized protein n=1 Tax=Penicillium capsulatum TaxID=69766 RepID=A0A9W9IB10_9EURO|nr:hypothetical protein N7492_004986 [Penicillium capsulatum]
MVYIGHSDNANDLVTAWVDLEAQRPGAAKPACDTRGPVEQFRWTKKNIVIVVVGIAMGATAVICVGLMAVEVIKTNPKAPR